MLRESSLPCINDEELSTDQNDPQVHSASLPLVLPPAQVSSDPEVLEHLEVLQNILAPLLESYQLVGTALLQLPASGMRGSWRGSGRVGVAVV